MASLFRDGELPRVVGVDVEPLTGYPFKVVFDDGSSRFARGGDVGLNSAASSAVVEDKAFAKYFLRQAGIDTPQGASFIMPWWGAEISVSGGTSALSMDSLCLQVVDYVGAVVGWPAYIKPADGSQGRNVWCCYGAEAVVTALQTFETDRVKIALVEEAIAMPDHRIVVFDGRVVAAYERSPLRVRGDGERSISALIDGWLEHTGRMGGRTSLVREMPRIRYRLGSQGRTLDDVPAFDGLVTLLDLTNLSAGGSAQDRTHELANRWRDLAVRVAEVFNLRFCGIDLACLDLRNSSGSYSVLEVNSSPGLGQYAKLGPGQQESVRALYREIFSNPS